MTALLRYLLADAVRAQRWVAPAVTFLAAIAVIDVGGGSALSCYSATSAALMAIALWLTIAVVSSEDPIQTAITVVIVGSPFRVQLGKLLTAYIGCLPLAGLGVLWPLVVGGHSFNATAIAAGLAAHLVTALTGVGFGALLSRPVLRHTAWAVLIGIMVCIAELAIPDFPPARQLLQALGADHPHGLGLSLVLIAVQAIALAAVAVAGAQRIARSRT